MTPPAAPAVAPGSPETRKSTHPKLGATGEKRRGSRGTGSPTPSLSKRSDKGDVYYHEYLQLDKVRAPTPPRLPRATPAAHPAGNPTRSVAPQALPPPPPPAARRPR
jgi:hypothetical protein